VELTKIQAPHPKKIIFQGYTPLHRAAENGSIQAIEYLLNVAEANPTERDLNDNSVPLHVAALNNNFICIKALLKFGVPDKPRTLDNKTPLDLAIAANHVDSIRILRSYEPKKIKIKLHEFLHESSVTRETAQRILLSSGLHDGSFLVRQSAKNPQLHVLSLLIKNEYFNYEISFKESERFYFIDDGPYFRSIEELVVHHMKYVDGLPGRLVYPIPPISQLNVPIDPILTQKTERLDLRQQQVSPTEQVLGKFHS
jgi:tyrosine-protein kinase